MNGDDFTIKRGATEGGSRVGRDGGLVSLDAPAQESLWSIYNAAQVEEKAKFAVLLADLCRNVKSPKEGLANRGRGRPGLAWSDVVFSCVYKVYIGFSSRRFSSDLEDARERGLIGRDRAPHFNSVSKYLSDPDLTPVFKSLVAASSYPLAAVEEDFAVDSSGFSTSRFVSWFNKKHRRVQDNREWVKLHLMCGVNTKIVTAADVSGWTAHGTNYFARLVGDTAERFEIREVSADKAYLSHKNFDAVDAVGGTPYIPFKSNTVKPVELPEKSVWSKMYHLYSYNHEDFLAHYHKRSNIESAFSMMKGKFGDSLRSKSDTGQINETLCKVLCHNVCVLIRSARELGIEPVFLAELRLVRETKEQKPLDE